MGMERQNKLRDRLSDVIESITIDSARLKRIKCFEDLPLDVQQYIETMSRSKDADGVNDYKTEKAERTRCAIVFHRTMREYAWLSQAVRNQETP